MRLLTSSVVSLIHYVNVYIKNLIILVQGGPSEWPKVRNHVFHSVDRFFQTNAPGEAMRQDPKLIKKLKKGYMVFKFMKLVLGWIIDTLILTISLPTSQLQKLQAALEAIPLTQCRTSRRKWERLVGILRSILPSLMGVGELFYHLQLVLSDSQVRLHLSAAVHAEL